MELFFYCMYIIYIFMKSLLWNFFKKTPLYLYYYLHTYVYIPCTQNIPSTRGCCSFVAIEIKFFHDSLTRVSLKIIAFALALPLALPLCEDIWRVFSIQASLRYEICRARHMGASARARERATHTHDHHHRRARACANTFHIAM